MTKKEIYRDAALAPVSKKGEVYWMLRDKLGEDRAAQDGFVFTDAEVIELLAYFAPSAPSTPKEPLSFCARAVGKSDRLPQLWWIHWAKDRCRLEATDGHRFHMVNDVDAVYPGEFLDRNGNAVEAGKITFPDIDRVLESQPVSDDKDAITITKLPVDDKARDFAVELPTGAWISLKFLLDIACKEEQVIMQAPVKDPTTSPHVFTRVDHPTWKAVIMPTA